VVERFYLDTVRRLLGEGWLRPDDDVLVVGGGPADRDVLDAAGLRTVTITNLDERSDPDAYAPFVWSRQDAEDLGYLDGAFDVCIVHQALHHCRSPHRALIEMYRVARRGIVAFEPHDAALTRLGVRLGVGQRYERAAVACNDGTHGGVRNTEIPNFVYRWTEREFQKTLASFDPRGDPHLRSFYDLRIPGAAARFRSGPARVVGRAAVPAARLVARVSPRQGNAIAVVADKVDPAVDLHPWLVARDGGVRVDREAVGRRSPGARR
jgi:SAM-dependent methyltransferase